MLLPAFVYTPHMHLVVPGARDRRSKNRVRAPLSPALGAALCVLFGVLLSGCSAQLPEGSTSILDLFKEPSPEIAAGWAMDSYDADKRMLGTTLLGNRPFAGDPVYLRL